jgi:hypothetical protein
MCQRIAVAGNARAMARPSGSQANNRPPGAK